MSKHTSEYTPEEQAAAEERYEKSLPKHTPGPWQANSGGQIWSSRKNHPANAVADVYSCTRLTERGQSEERNANAALIAAAPELYETLNDLRRLFESGRVTFTADVPASLEYDAIVGRAAAALAKANGEQS